MSPCLLDLFSAGRGGGLGVSNSEERKLKDVSSPVESVNESPALTVREI